MGDIDTIVVTVLDGESRNGIENAEVGLQGSIVTALEEQGNGIYLTPSLPGGEVYNVAVKSAGDFPVPVYRPILIPRNGVVFVEALMGATNEFDLNGDGQINAVEIQLLINEVMGPGSSEVNCDVNKDGATNAVDIQMMIVRVLGI